MRERVESGAKSLPPRLVDLHKRERRIAGQIFACAVAFRLFLLLVPVLLVLVAGIGFLHGSDIQRQASDELGFSQVLIDTVATVGEEASRGRWAVLWVGLLAAAVAIRSLVATLRTTHMMAWDMPGVGRPQRPVDLGTGLGVATAVVGYVVAGQWMRTHVPGGSAIASFTIGLGTTLVYLAVEALLPRGKGVTWRDLLPGAVLVGVGTQALHALTVFQFAGRITKMTSTYGPLGIAAVTLLWLYLLGRMMVAAAVLNADLWERRSLDSTAAPARSLTTSD